MMDEMKELLALEKQGWKALSTEGDAGKRFYRSILREDAIMVFPGGMIVDGKKEVLDSLDAQPWDTYQITEHRMISLLGKSSVLIYRVKATRGNSEPYEALISSTYVKEAGSWKLVCHQQTLV